MATCPSGHASASDDFCDVCGVLIGAAPELGFDGGLGSGGAAAPDGAQAAGLTVVGGAPPGEACRQCGVTRAGQFCESCGYDFTTALAAPHSAAWTVAPAPASSVSVPPVSVPPAPASFAPAPETVAPASASGAGVPGAPVHWAAVVTADRAYFDSVLAADGPDVDTISFPAYYPQRQFPLSGTEMRIGRRSVSSGITPEIDLSVPPSDPGVSRLHAVLLRSPDGTWAVVDPGSANGTLVNGTEIPEGQAVPVRPGDLIHVGAWTAISIVSEP
ncbi:FHA domain-containing protein [Trebonia kvetii]|uniref:FHA domain-containing protein n=1 Tax=Trebonia kvetii TaxID=2480626 RepID=A0A6P2BW03_9ACTN|nr:FHA domain-containing protein [Trebonia kvetii]TVZ03234.1 FHA domain-containing protein [Trebonia kvetii]